jgi:hypothetical protein
MSFLNISSDVLVDIIQSWVKVKCIAKLDSACSNFGIRFDFLNLLKHDCVMLETDKNRKNSFFKWVFERSIKLSTIYLSTNENFETSKTLYHKINLVNIDKLVINESYGGPYKDMDFIDIINSCVRIRYLYIVHRITDDVVIKMTRLSQLQVFRIRSENNQFTPKIIQLLAEQCRNLMDVDLYFKFHTKYLIDQDKFQTEFRNNLSNLFKQNKLMSKFKLDLMDITQKFDFISNDESITDSWGLIDIINQNCPNIEKCYLNFSGTINVSHIASFINNNDQLTLLKLTNCSYYKDYDPDITYIKNTNVKEIYCNDFEDPFSETMEDDRDSNLEHLFSSVKNFTEIILNTINMLSDDFIRLITSKNCATLVSFKLDVRCTNWSLSSIRTMISECKLLQQLSLIHCYHILDVEFDELCSVPNILSHLVIEDAKHVTTATLIKLITHSTYLCHFYYELCPLVNMQLVDEFCNKTL